MFTDGCGVAELKWSVSLVSLWTNKGWSSVDKFLSFGFPQCFATSGWVSVGTLTCSLYNLPQLYIKVLI